MRKQRIVGLVLFIFSFILFICAIVMLDGKAPNLVHIGAFALLLCLGTIGLSVLITADHKIIRAKRELDRSPRP